MRRVTITIRQNQIVLWTGRNTRRAWCDACGARRDMIAMDELLGVGQSAVQTDWIDSAALHRVETADGRWLICIESLMAWVANEQANFRRQRVAQIKERS